MNKRRSIFVVTLLLAAAAAWYGYINAPEYFFAPNDAETPSGVTEETAEDSMINVVARNLSIPWDIAFLPDGGMLVTERPGTLLLLQGKERTEVPITDARVEHAGEGGLLGVALHPAFQENQFVYLYMTSPREEGGGLVNRVVRFTFANGALVQPHPVIENIPGAPYHDGGRIRFGPDGKLYITTGDATESEQAQDTNSLAGKILRLNPDGTIPADNPFGNAVYSYGHRNPQGITWDDQNRLWITEHGRSGVRSGLDELNLVTAGSNYGWPESQGDTVLEGTVSPVIHSGADATWAPASAEFYAYPGGSRSIFFGGLRGEALYEAILNGHAVAGVKAHFREEFGRIRSVMLGPDGWFYITTSNTDGRGTPREGDDKIIKINPELFTQ